MQKKQILLTNDDSIRSPGLWAAADALSDLGYVTVAAPRDQSSGMGCSLPSTSDGTINPQILNVRGREWTVYAVGGSPAQAVMHGVLEIMPIKPDLVVSGINYGENLATGIIISGTVGAAMEAAVLGIPALAMSLEVEPGHFLTHSTEIDFSAAAWFTTHFARILLEKRFPGDVDLIKVDIPSDATPATPWALTRLSRQLYYIPKAPERRSWAEPARMGFDVLADFSGDPPDSDAYVLRVRRQVSVTPLSLDTTSRADFATVENLLRSG